MDEQEVDLRDYINVLLKRKKLIIGITLVAIIIAGILSYFVFPKVYNPTNNPGDQIGVYRPSDRRFYMRSPTGTVTAISFGITGDTPIIGDWNGDGKDEIGVYRPSDRRFYMRSSTGTVSVISFGITGDKPIVGIWN